jgi:WD repeat-containing protein 61
MDGIINIFTETGTKKHTIEAHTGCIRALSFSSDGKTLVSGSDDTFIHIYETTSGQLLRTISGHASWVLSVAVSPNNKFIASGSNDKNVKVWDLATGEALSSLNKEHTEAVWGVAWNNVGTKLIAVGDAQIVMYNCLDK